MKNRNEKSEAAIVVLKSAAGPFRTYEVEGRVKTNWKNGATVYYGERLNSEGKLIYRGVGRISRAKKYLEESQEKPFLRVVDYFEVPLLESDRL